MSAHIDDLPDLGDGHDPSDCDVCEREGLEEWQKNSPVGRRVKAMVDDAVKARAEIDRLRTALTNCIGIHDLMARRKYVEDVLAGKS